jgi:nonsense-mediated mRNA decay protein 3
LILKHKAHEKTIGIKQTAEGLDFQYKQDSHSNRLVQFIKDHFVARTKHNKQLISHDEQNAEYFYKYTNFIELAPICKDDLVLLSPKQMKLFGGIGPLILVYKVTTCVHVVDVKTMRTHEIAGPKYWENMFTPICTRERLSEFIVINIEDVDFEVSTSKAAAR